MHYEQKKPKVLFVITKSNFGGAQKYVYDLAVCTPKDEFEVVVAMGGAGILVDKLRAQNIRTITIPSLTRDIDVQRDLTSFKELLAIFRAERPDILHLNSSKIGGIGALAGRIAHIPHIIFTAHGWAWNEEHRSFLQRIVIKCVSWLTIMLAHKTIAVSETVWRESAHFPFAHSKTVVIKNGISPIDFFSRTAARDHLSAHMKTALDPETFLVGTIAELHKNKGLSYAIQACAPLAQSGLNFHYLIIGEGEERESLINQIAEHGLQNHVSLAGFLDNAARHLKAFDCFLLPSLKEGLPYVLLEAGLAQIPIIATNVGGIPDLIKDNETGILIAPENALNITNALETLISNTNLQARLGEALHKKVQGEFSLEDMCAETIALYRHR